MTIENLFEKDSEAFKVADEGLEGVAKLGRRAKELEKQIEEHEAILKGVKDQFRKLSEETIPEALTELGMKSFTMDDGSQITIKPFYGASIPEARRAEAYQWLRDHGFDDIIKNTVSVRFGRGEDELCARLLGLLGEQGFPSEQAEKIEPATLKAWAKEQVERGNAIPADLFGLFVGQKAVIKSV
jgi:hypothetical protein